MRRVCRKCEIEKGTADFYGKSQVCADCCKANYAALKDEKPGAYLGLLQSRRMAWAEFKIKRPIEYAAACKRKAEAERIRRKKRRYFPKGLDNKTRLRLDPEYAKRVRKQRRESAARWRAKRGAQGS